MGATRGQKASREETTLLAIDVLGLPEIQEWVKKSPKKTKAALRAAMYESVMLVKSRVMDELDNKTLMRRSHDYYRGINTLVRIHQSSKAYYGVIGTHVHYAPYHEFGSPDTNLPRRPIWVPVFREARPDIIRLHQHHIQKMLREAGSKTGIRRNRFKVKTMRQFRKRKP